MSKFFKARHLVGTNVIPLDPNFKCPASYHDDPQAGHEVEDPEVLSNRA